MLARPFVNQYIVHVGAVLKNRRHPGFRQHTYSRMWEMMTDRPYGGRCHNRIPDPVCGTDEQTLNIFSVNRYSAHLNSKVLDKRLLLIELPGATDGMVLFSSVDATRATVQGTGSAGTLWLYYIVLCFLPHLLFCHRFL
jgi:hypothetical protein